MPATAPSAQGRRLRAAIERAGGLHSISDLATRWGISRQRARSITRMSDFPAPIRTAGGAELWLGLEADAFRAIERKPGPKPNRNR